MPNPTIVKLFERIQAPRSKDNPVGQLYMYSLIAINDAKAAALLGKHPMPELHVLILQALSDTDPQAGAAADAATAFYDMVTAELAERRKPMIEACRRAIRSLDPKAYPHTTAQVHLKLGGALAVLSNKGKDTIREAVEHLERFLTLEGDDGDIEMRYLAHFNLTLAYGSNSWDDWDGLDDAGHSRSEQVIAHGRAALALMDQGAEGGNRDVLTQAVAQQVLLGASGAKTQEAAEALALFMALKRSPEFARLPATRRKEVNSIIKNFQDAIAAR